MQIDTAYPIFKKLTQEEKKRRMENKLCLYCGKPGHIVKECPTAPKD
jgi:Zinc knuckle